MSDPESKSPKCFDNVVDVRCLARTYGLCCQSNDLADIVGELMTRRTSITKENALYELDRAINLLQQLVQRN